MSKWGPLAGDKTGKQFGPLDEGDKKQRTDDLKRGLSAMRASGSFSGNIASPVRLLRHTGSIEIPDPAKPRGQPPAPNADRRPAAAAAPVRTMGGFGEDLSTPGRHLRHTRSIESPALPGGQPPAPGTDSKSTPEVAAAAAAAAVGAPGVNSPGLRRVPSGRESRGTGQGAHSQAQAQAQGPLGAAVRAQPAGVPASAAVPVGQDPRRPVAADHPFATAAAPPAGAEWKPSGATPEVQSKGYNEKMPQRMSPVAEAPRGSNAPAAPVPKPAGIGPGAANAAAPEVRVAAQAPAAAMRVDPTKPQNAAPPKPRYGPDAADDSDDDFASFEAEEAAAFGRSRRTPTSPRQQPAAAPAAAARPAAATARPGSARPGAVAARAGVNNAADFSDSEVDEEPAASSRRGNYGGNYTDGDYTDSDGDEAYRRGPAAAPTRVMGAAPAERSGDKPRQPGTFASVSGGGGAAAAVGGGSKFPPMAAKPSPLSAPKKAPGPAAVSVPTEAPAKKIDYSAMEKELDAMMPKGDSGAPRSPGGARAPSPASLASQGKTGDLPPAASASQGKTGIQSPASQGNTGDAGIPAHRPDARS